MVPSACVPGLGPDGGPGPFGAWLHAHPAVVHLAISLVGGGFLAWARSSREQQARAEAENRSAEGDLFPPLLGRVLAFAALCVGLGVAVWFAVTVLGLLIEALS